jgi:hypothetical protein
MILIEESSSTILIKLNYFINNIDFHLACNRYT